jgi:hypothetical protein
MRFWIISSIACSYSPDGITIPAFVSLLFWYKTLVTLVDSASMSFSSIQEWNSLLTIKLGHIWFLFSLHCAVSIVLIVITARSNLMWYWAFMFGYFALFGCMLLVHQSLLIVLLLKQYKEMKDLDNRLYFSGDKLLEDGPSNANRLTDKTSTFAPSKSLSKSMSSSYSTIHDMRLQRVLNLAKMFVRAALTTIAAIAAVLGAVFHLSSRPQLTLQDEVATNVQVYTVNWDILVLLSIFTTLRVFGIFSVWLPLSPKHKQEPEAVEMKAKA